MISTIGEDAYWVWWSTEWFRAAPVEPRPPGDGRALDGARPAEHRSALAVS
jgi:hypothetical protein